jgi:hypothetical protein
MRKLFVLFLLISLVPFTVGCNGLWDFDDDNDPVAMKTITKNVKLPSSVVSGANLRAAVGYNSLELWFNGVKMSVSGTPTFDEATNMWTVVFKGLMSQAQFNGLTGKTVTTKLMSGTSTLLEFTFVVTSGTNDGDTITVSDSTTIPGDLTAAITTTDGSSAPLITLVPVDMTLVPQLTTTVKVNGANVSSTLTGAKTVSSLNPIFQLDFSAAPKNLSAATWEVIVTHVNATTGATIKSYTLDSTDNKALFSVTARGTTGADLKVVGEANTVYTLEAGATYKVTLKTSNLVDVNETILNNPGTFYFKTAATTYPNTTVTVTPTTIASGTGKVLTMTFSQEVKAAPEAGSKVTITRTTPTATVVAERSADSSDITITQSTTDKKVVTLTINTEIIAGTHTVAVTNGSWLDTNGNAVEPIKATFTVE